jgi:hypothetical protein
MLRQGGIIQAYSNDKDFHLLDISLIFLSLQPSKEHWSLLTSQRERWIQKALVDASPVLYLKQLKGDGSGG